MADDSVLNCAVHSNREEQRFLKILIATRVVAARELTTVPDFHFREQEVGVV
jgi:hypothetical protein